jgi:hypothetical protein
MLRAMNPQMARPRAAHAEVRYATFGVGSSSGAWHSSPHPWWFGGVDRRQETANTQKVKRMVDWLLPLGVLAVWLLLQIVILPRMGVET